MATAQDIKDARKTKVLERRAARTRRSKWLGRVLFSLTGIGLALLLRMNPGIVEDAVILASGASAEGQSQSVATSSDARKRHMPKDVVPVRRGGMLPQGTHRDVDAQAQADDVAATLRDLKPGG